jgi:hypothetical protein
MDIKTYFGRLLIRDLAYDRRISCAATTKLMGNISIVNRLRFVEFYRIKSDNVKYEYAEPTAVQIGLIPAK